MNIPRDWREMADNLEIENKMLWAQLVAINWINYGRTSVQQVQGGEKSGKRVCYIQLDERMGSAVISEVEGKDE